MKLTTQEYREYLKTHIRFLYFVARKCEILPTPKMAFEDFLDLDMNVKFAARNAFLSDDTLLDKYLKIFKNRLSASELDILGGFKKSISNSFLFLKTTKDYNIFLDRENEKIYGVKALGDPLDTLISQIPTFVTAIILPFRGKIIYDGFLGETPTKFTKEQLVSMELLYKAVMEENKLITHLD